MKAAAILNYTTHSGDDDLIEVTVTEDGSVVNIAGADIDYLLAKAPGGLVLISKTIGDGVEITDAANGVFEVSIDEADTVNLAPGNYRHMARLTETNGRTTVVMTGTMTILPYLQPGS